MPSRRPRRAGAACARRGRPGRPVAGSPALGARPGAPPGQAHPAAAWARAVEAQAVGVRVFGPWGRSLRRRGGQMRSRRPRWGSAAHVRRFGTVEVAAAQARQRGSYMMLRDDEYRVNPAPTGCKGVQPARTCTHLLTEGVPLRRVAAIEASHDPSLERALWRSPAPSRRPLSALRHTAQHGIRVRHHRRLPRAAAVASVAQLGVPGQPTERHPSAPKGKGPRAVRGPKHLGYTVAFGPGAY